MCIYTRFHWRGPYFHSGILPANSFLWWLTISLDFLRYFNVSLDILGYHFACDALYSLHRYLISIFFLIFSCCLLPLLSSFLAYHSYHRPLDLTLCGAFLYFFRTLLKYICVTCIQRFNSWNLYLPCTRLSLYHPTCYALSFEWITFTTFLWKSIKF